MVVISEVPEDEPKAAAEPTPATLKAQGNQLFASGDYEGAVTCYLEAVELSGTTERQEQQNKEIAVFKANVAACYMKTGRYADAVQFCTEALEVDGGYVKALVRRAQAREKQQPANDKGLEVLTLIHDGNQRTHSGKAAKARVQTTRRRQSWSPATPWPSRAPRSTACWSRPSGKSKRQRCLVKRPHTTFAG